LVSLSIAQNRTRNENHVRVLVQYCTPV